MSLLQDPTLVPYQLPPELVDMASRNALASLPRDGALEAFMRLSKTDRCGPQGLALAGVLMDEHEAEGQEGVITGAASLAELEHHRNEIARHYMSDAPLASILAEDFRAAISLQVFSDSATIRQNQLAAQLAGKPDEQVVGSGFLESIRKIGQQPTGIELVTADGYLSNHAFKIFLGTRDHFTPTGSRPLRAILAVLPHEQRRADDLLVRKFGELAERFDGQALPGIKGGRLERGPHMQVTLHGSMAHFNR